MVATLLLIANALGVGQTGRPFPAPTAPADRGSWLVAPRLGASQELAYRGTFAEEARGGTVQFSRFYRLEMRVFVLATPPRGLDVALLTLLRPRDVNPGVSDSPGLSSVRLERLRVDWQGQVSCDTGGSLAVPLEGAPSIECGAFVEVPSGRVDPGKEWETAEAGRPPRRWRTAGMETIQGSACVRLVSVQQSEDWEQPRADRTAWRRQDTVWMLPRFGIACRVERVIERREPARREPTQRSVLRYELESSLQYPGQLNEDRRQEILQALAFREMAAPLLATPARYAPQLAALLKKINAHLERQPPTPYREAVLQVQRRVEAARRGEIPPVLPEETPQAPAVASIGSLAPDFVVSAFTSPASARLRQWLGRPTLLVFYQPSSSTAAELLLFAQRLDTTHGQRLAVLGMSVVEDAEQVLPQRAALRLSFPILNGSGLRASYAVETTPKIVLLDGAGIVRGAWLGWGRETAHEVQEELRRWLK